MLAVGEGGYSQESFTKKLQISKSVYSAWLKHKNEAQGIKKFCTKNNLNDNEIVFKRIFSEEIVLMLFSCENYYGGFFSEAEW